MSEVEMHIGRLKEIDFNGLDPEEYFEKRCNEKGITELHQWSDSWEDEFDNEFRLIRSGGKYYEIIHDTELDGYEDICEVFQRDDGTYDYVMKFYNGGTCLSEMLEDGMNDSVKK